MSEEQSAPLGEPYPQSDIDFDACPVVNVNEQPSLYARKGSYIPPDVREDVILKLMEYQTATIVLMRRYGADVTKITPQEVQLAKHIGSTAEIDDDGGLTVKVFDSMGS